MYQCQRISKNQSLILNLLQEIHDTLSAQEVHYTLKTRGYGIGLATVYRALESLKLQGAIKSTTTPAGEALYSIIPLDRHYLHCLHCGRSFVLPSCPLEGMNQKLKQTYDFDIFYHNLEFFGICRECQGQKQAQLEQNPA